MQVKICHACSLGGWRHPNIDFVMQIVSFSYHAWCAKYPQPSYANKKKWKLNCHFQTLGTFKDTSHDMGVGKSHDNNFWKQRLFRIPPSAQIQIKLSQLPTRRKLLRIIGVFHITPLLSLQNIILMKRVTCCRWCFLAARCQTPMCGCSLERPWPCPPQLQNADCCAHCSSSPGTWPRGRSACDGWWTWIGCCRCCCHARFAHTRLLKGQWLHTE